jgi:hypothetical protein
LDEIETEYTETQITRIEACLDQLVAPIMMPERKCAGGCGRILEMDIAQIYDHSGGWSLIGDIPKQWISFKCSCGYETSLDKLGVSR